MIAVEVLKAFLLNFVEVGCSLSYKIDYRHLVFCLQLQLWHSSAPSTGAGHRLLPLVISHSFMILGDAEPTKMRSSRASALKWALV